jgi:DNA-binding PadR family transcriptional regulator
LFTILFENKLLTGLLIIMSVRFAILGLLTQRPRHGYELRAAFSVLVGGDKNWDVKPAQIYTTLNRLEDAGMVMQLAVEKDGGPSKTIYKITKEGEQSFHDWLAVGVTPQHQHDEFFIKLMTGLVSGAADPSRLIQTQRAHLYQDLHAATTLRDQFDRKKELAQILLMDKTIMHLEADIHWLDFAERRIEEIKKQPFPQPETRMRGRPKKQ